MMRPAPDVISILKTLVAFDTTSENSNLPLIAWVRDRLAQYGVQARVVPDETGEKALLFARIGPDDGPSVALSAHTDVVPVKGQDWTSDPFTLTERDGRLYGRGACDMKGFVALVLAAVPALTERELKRPVEIVLTYDEETSMAGVVHAISELGNSWRNPAAVIIGEPTNMEVVDAHLSIAGLSLDFHGRAAHSSMPQLGASAIMAAHDTISELARIQDEFRVAGDPTGRFAPPYSTLNIGRIEGGAAHNIVADRCRMSFSARGVPGCDIEAVMDRVAAFAESTAVAKMRETAPEARVDIRRWLTAPALEPDPGSEAEQLAMRLAGRNDTTTVSYATEAGFFQRAQLATVVCGPGSIDQAHAPDEYITLEQLALGEAFLKRLIEECRA